MSSRTNRRTSTTSRAKPTTRSKRTAGTTTRPRSTRSSATTRRTGSGRRSSTKDDPTYEATRGGSSNETTRSDNRSEDIGSNTSADASISLSSSPPARRHHHRSRHSHNHRRSGGRRRDSSWTDRRADNRSGGTRSWSSGSRDSRSRSDHRRSGGLAKDHIEVHYLAESKSPVEIAFYYMENAKNKWLGLKSTSKKGRLVASTNIPSDTSATSTVPYDTRPRISGTEAIFTKGYMSAGDPNLIFNLVGPDKKRATHVVVLIHDSTPNPTNPTKCIFTPNILMRELNSDQNQMLFIDTVSKTVYEKTRSAGTVRRYGGYGSYGQSHDSGYPSPYSYGYGYTGGSGYGSSGNPYGNYNTSSWYPSGSSGYSGWGSSGYPSAYGNTAASSGSPYHTGGSNHWSSRH